MSLVISLTFQLALNTDSQMYSQSSSNIDTYGYIYENRFNPFNTTENLLASDDNGGGTGGQFKFEIPLYVGTTYILVVTTVSPKQIGEIKISLLGLTNVTVRRLSE
jgi:hypothetical protein